MGPFPKMAFVEKFSDEDAGGDEGAGEVVSMSSMRLGPDDCFGWDVGVWVRSRLRRPPEELGDVKEGN